MQIKFIRFIDELFAGVPQTRKVLEMKEEIVQNLMEKYNDLLAQGKSEEAAFHIATSSIGDVNDLLGELDIPRAPVPDMSSYGEDPRRDDFCDQDGYQDMYDSQAVEDMEKRRKAFATSIAVMLYILSPVPVIFLQDIMGVALLFIMIACATGLLIYMGMTKGKPSRVPAGRPSFASQPMYGDGCEACPTDSKEPEDRASYKKAEKKAQSSLSSAFWIVVVVIYFLVSFRTGAWHITWLIYLIGAAISRVIKAYWDLSRMRR